MAATVLLVLYIRSKDRGSHEPTGALWGAAGFGVLAIALAVPLEIFLVHSDPSSGPTGITAVAFRDAMMIGLIEEACKFLPLAFFIYKRSYFNEHTDGVLYFAIAGLGFGLPENLAYSLDGGIVTGLVRLILTPYFHAATTACIGYFLIRKKLSKQSVLPVSLAFLGMIVLHGLYDFGLFTGIATYAIASVVITLSLTGCLFWLTHRAMRLDQRMGLAAVGDNRYCRSCGRANPKQFLFCIFCGNKT